MLEYGSVVWDPYLHKNIDRLEQVQRRAARFITGNYRSRDEGCVTKMVKSLELTSLQDRRTANRLFFLYRVVEGLVPAIQPADYLKPIRPKRSIKARKFADCISANIVEQRVTNNSKCFEIDNCKTAQYKQSFFVKTLVDWNHLDNSTVCAKSCDAFKMAVTVKNHSD